MAKIAQTDNDIIDTLYRLELSKYKLAAKDKPDSSIFKDPGEIFDYAKNVIKGRWPEKEPILMKDPHWAYTYARYVIKGRWPEAEPYIMKDLEAAYLYSKWFFDRRTYWRETKRRQRARGPRHT